MRIKPGKNPILCTTVLLMLILMHKQAISQAVITELNRQLFYENKAYPLHALKPYLAEGWKNFTDIVPKKKKSRLSNALFYSDLLKYDSGNGINFSVNPLLNLEAGKDRAYPQYADTLLYTNTRGFKIEGNLGPKFTFYTSFYENQSRYPGYIDAYVRETRASVGMGRTKAFKTYGHDYAMAGGMIVYRPVQSAEIWFGHGKNFIGHGYRSLFLSDHTANYPHLKVNLKLIDDKLRYTFVFASLMSSERFRSYSTSEPALYRKGANFNYLSYTPSAKLEIGLFESILWKRVSNNRSTPVNALQFNPVMFAGTATQGLNGKNNASLGLNLAYKPVETLAIYGQALLDGKRKNGLQLGVYKRDLFIKNLYLQAEYNQVNENTYAAADSLENYTHLWQPLAHPLGAGFNEFNGVVNYRYKRFIFDAQLVYAKLSNGYGVPGQNLVYSEAQYDQMKPAADVLPLTAKYFFVKPAIGFIINPATNMQIRGGIITRNADKIISSHRTSYIFVALSTNLNNLYFDL